MTFLLSSLTWTLYIIIHSKLEKGGDFRDYMFYDGKMKRDKGRKSEVTKIPLQEQRSSQMRFIIMYYYRNL